MWVVEKYELLVCSNDEGKLRDLVFVQKLKKEKYVSVV